MVAVQWTPPAFVMDCGTGYSKLGFAGNVQVCPCIRRQSEPTQKNWTEISVSQ